MTENKRFTFEYSNYHHCGEIHDWSRSYNAVLVADYLQKWELEEWCQELNKIVDENNQLRKENEQLKAENTELKAKVDDKEVAVEVECEKLMQKVLDLIDEKIKLHSHKPVSASISQPMSVNFDADVDRLARLSELEALKEELTE